MGLMLGPVFPKTIHKHTFGRCLSFCEKRIKKLFIKLENCLIVLTCFQKIEEIYLACLEKINFL